MKKIQMYLSVLCIALATACSKKSNSGPAIKIPTVTIGRVAYPTVTIGNQVWTTQNYRGTTSDMVNNSTTDSLIGNYYSAASARTISLPAGWHVPTYNDYNTLLGNYSSNVDNNNNVICNQTLTKGLMSITGWTGISGTNTSGFNAYPGGFAVYVKLSKKTLVNGQYKVAVYLTSNGVTYPDYVSGISVPSTYVLRLNSTGYIYHFYTYYGSIGFLADDGADVTGSIGYGSLRFVKDN